MSPLNDQTKSNLAAACALGGALLYLIFVISESVLTGGQSPSNAPVVATVTGPTPDGHSDKIPDTDISTLAKLHVFGRYTPPAINVADEKPTVAEPELDLSALPKTKINLKLSGIGYSANDARASAIIVTPDGQHDHFVIGEEIVANATVHLIERERVIIKHNGKLEVLELPEAGAGNPNLPNRNRRIARRNEPRTNKTQVTR